MRAYLGAVNPIADPRLADGTLTFTNAAVDADVARPPRAYRTSWWTFDNATGTGPARLPKHRMTTSLAALADLPAGDGVFIKVQLSAVRSGGVRSGGPSGPPVGDSWERPVDAFFRLRDGQWRLVGFERMPEGQ
jgi:hypothetical protein